MQERRAPRPSRPRPAPPRTSTPPSPVVPDDVSGADLDPEVRRELRALPKDLADRVAGHLAAAQRALETDLALAREHAREARRLAPRLAATREAAGLTAYLCGEYADAARDLRAVRRITGRPDHLPVIADCERGLGRPERALALARDPAARELDRAGRVEMGIVESGARRDLGEYDAAVVALQGRELDSPELHAWTPRLWYAYAAALLDVGRLAEALDWFRAVAAVDDERETDAEERVAQLEAGGG